MKHSIYIFTICLFFLSSCKGLKTKKLFSNGEVSHQEFKTEIPFEYRNGLILLKVTIEGKQYDFVLDTGAPNVVSKELAQQLNLKNKLKRKVGDSQNASSKLSFTKVKKITIGDIDFLNTGAIISDLSLGAVGCLEIDGLIGGNLMQKAIWKIDYLNKVITIANSRDALQLSGTQKIIPFIHHAQGTPLINIRFNNVLQKNVKYDTGSNKGISAPKKVLNQLVNAGASIPMAHGFGISSYGLYGAGKMDSLYFGKVENISLGDITLKNQSVQFKKKGSILLGTQFFKNYVTILDWFKKEIILIPQKEVELDKPSFGFSHILKDQKLSVIRLMENSNAAKKGIQIGDQIVKIGEKDYTTTTWEDWCELINNGITKDNEVTITILKDGKEKSITLKKEKMF